MSWTRAELKERAKFSLRKFFWSSVLVGFILSLLSGSGGSNAGRKAEETFKNNGVDSLGDIGAFIAAAAIVVAVVAIVAAVVGILLSVLVFNPLIIGCKRYFLEASQGNSDLSNIGYAFRENYANQVLVMFVTNLSIFLWSLLFVIPGVIKGYAYRMVPYLLAEDPTLTPAQAKDLSARMMQGEKWETFVLDLSFILWNFLAAITLNIVGIFWVNPYVAYTDAELYKVVRTKVEGPYYYGNVVDEQVGENY